MTTKIQNNQLEIQSNYTRYISYLISSIRPLYPFCYILHFEEKNLDISSVNDLLDSLEKHKSPFINPSIPYTLELMIEHTALMQKIINSISTSESFHRILILSFFRFHLEFHKTFLPPLFLELQVIENVP